MKSLKHRKRYKLGLTDYYHREKMLKNYDKVIRVYLKKKRNYYCASLIETPVLNKPDKVALYLESRWFQNIEKKALKNTLYDAYLFGCLMGAQIIERDLLINKKNFILDLGRNKKRIFSTFLLGLSKTLGQKSLQDFGCKILFSEAKLKIKLGLSKLGVYDKIEGRSSNQFNLIKNKKIKKTYTF